MTTPLNAQIETSFKGENLTLKGTLDLDHLHYDPENPIPVYHHIATQNNIDQYSYLYEILEVEPVHFSSEDPVVAQFISEDGTHFDWEGFKKARKTQRAAQATEKLLAKYQNQLTSEDALKQALIEAYLLGSKQGD